MERVDGGWSVSVEDGLYKLEHELRMLPGVTDVHQTRPVPRELHVLVTLWEFDWDVRQQVIDIVDDFARTYVEEISVLVDVVDRTDLADALSA